MEELAKLAYEAALRTLDKQEEVVRELRSRTAVVLAASSFAISLVGAPALRASPAMAVGAVAAAVVALSGSLYILLPQPRLRFAVHGRRILEETYEPPEHVDAYRRLVYDLGRIWDANDVILRRLLGGLRWAALALVLEILFLLGALRSTL